MPEGYLKGKPDADFWMTQIVAGEKFRKKYAHEEKWKIWRQYYRNIWKGGILPSALIFKTLRTTVPRVYFRNPSISLVATKPGLENMIFSQLLERIDNKLIRRMKIKKQMKRMVMDGFLFGTAIGGLGYGAEFTPSPDLLNTEAPIGTKGEIFEYNRNVRANMPWFLRVSPGHFIVPAGLDDIDSSRWVAQWIRRPLADVKADSRLRETSQLGPTSRPTEQSKQGTSEEEPVDMVDLYQVRDKKTRKVFVLAPYATDKILYYGDDDLQVDGNFPYFTVSFNEDDEYFWGISDVKVLEPLQLELNETRTQIMKHRRMSLVKILAKIGAISEPESSKLVDEDVCPVVQVQGDPRTDIVFREGSNIPEDLFRSYELTKGDAREAVGFSRNQFGEYRPGSGDTTATEAQIVKMASEIRVDERRDMLADMLVDIVTHMHTIIFSRWQEEQVIDIMGPNGMPVWVRFKPDMLRNGAYEVKVDPDTSVPETKQMREAKAIQMYQLFREDPMIDPIKLRRYLLHELHGTSFDDLLFIPQGMPGSEESPMGVGQLQEMIRATANQAQGGGAK